MRHGPVTGPRAVSHEVRRAGGRDVCRGGRGSSGSPRWCRRACFHARARPVLLDRPPGVSTQLHSSCCVASSERLRDSSAPPFRAERPARVSSLVTTSLERVHQSRGLPGPRSVPSSGVHSLSTVCSARELRGLFHPRAVFRDCRPFRGFSLRVARRSRRASLPPCRWRPGARPDLSIRRPRPEASASRLPSTRRRVRTGSVLSLTGGRSPLRVVSPPGALRSGWGREFLATHRS